MAITTYAELQAAIANWLNRDDLKTEVTDFISLGEAQINRDIRHWQAEKRATNTMNSRFTDLPSDVIEVIRLQLDNDYEPLKQIPPVRMHEMRAASNDTAGRPCHYSVIDGGFEVFPTPDDDYTATLYYRAKIPALSDSNPTNWLLSLAPDVYLYASLMASAPFLRDEDRIGVWSTLYLAGVEGVNKQSYSTKHGGPLIMRPAS